MGFGPPSPITSHRSVRASRATRYGWTGAPPSGKRSHPQPPLWMANRSGGADCCCSQPLTGTPLRFGDFARRHVVRHFGTAQRRVLVAADSRKIEPFVRFDVIALKPMAAGGVGDAEVEVAR